MSERRLSVGGTRAAKLLEGQLTADGNERLRREFGQRFSKLNRGLRAIVMMNADHKTKATLHSLWRAHGECELASLDAPPQTASYALSVWAASTRTAIRSIVKLKRLLPKRETR